MNKKDAQNILNTSNEKLIEFWKKSNSPEYILLSRTKSDEEIADKVKKVAKDVLEDKASTFVITDSNGKKYTRLEYLGEESNEKEEKK